jgi:3-mercaptopyruvate sulfurtransferase SseA
MRYFAAAMAVVALGGVASAQYRTPPQGTPAIPVTPNPNVQITPVNPVEQSLESARRITREEAIKMVGAHKAVYVDVRTKDQYDIGHIKGAINIPSNEVAARMKELPKGKFIITYCA